MIELKRFVERVVRPVPSPDVWQKIRMREELYAHVFDAYEHELRLTDDKKEAQRRAIARMGDPEVLTEELCSPIPWIDRGSYKIDKFFARRPGEAFGRLSFRVAKIITGIMAVATIIPCAVRYSEILDWGQKGQITVRLMLSLSGCFVVGAFLLTLLAELVVRYLAEPKSRLEDTMAATLIAIISFTVILPLGIAVHLIATWNLAELSAAFWSCLPAALAGAAVSAGACIANALESRAAAPWLELEIDG